MSKPLGAEMVPVVDASLAEVGAVQSYDNVMGRYQKIPFVPDARANLNEYVVQKGMDGFSTISQWKKRRSGATRRGGPPSC